MGAIKAFAVPPAAARRCGRGLPEGERLHTAKSTLHIRRRVLLTCHHLHSDVHRADDSITDEANGTPSIGGARSLPRCVPDQGHAVHGLLHRTLKA